MSPSAATSTSRRIPRLLRLDLAKQWTTTGTKTNNGGGCSSSFWSPKELLNNPAYFAPNLSLTVKRSTTSRFFMYEEHSTSKLQEVETTTQVIQCSPKELADLLHNNNNNNNTYRNDKGDKSENNGDGGSGGGDSVYYCYWTSPVADVAPNLLNEVLQGYQSLYDNGNDDDSQQQQQKILLDPRGPSLWMGNAGSGTQAHYDVADNILIQLYGSKRIKCYPPTAATYLHVFPDAHPKARKSQIDFDDSTDDHANDEMKKKLLFPHYYSDSSSLKCCEPILDVVLEPGMAISIPAFWFHHVENGPSSLSSQQPTLSLNLFALSNPMMIAQKIFQRASQPFSSSSTLQQQHHQQQQEGVVAAAALLKALCQSLFEALRMDAKQFIREDLLDTRYVPLMKKMKMRQQQQVEQHYNYYSDPNNNNNNNNNKLSPLQQEQVNQCIDRIVPLLESLRKDERGIMELVVAHLLELWAVEMVGSNNVAKVWETVLLDMK